MERFIKLHLASTGDDLWLRVGCVSGLSPRGTGAAVFDSYVASDEHTWIVTETPAEILALIEQHPAMPTIDEDGCCDVCGRDLHGCAACSGYVDPEDIRETHGGEKT